MNKIILTVFLLVFTETIFSLELHVFQQTTSPESCESKAACKKSKMVFINENCKIMGDLQLDRLSSDFDENGLSIASDDSKYGFIDRSLRIVIPLKYRSVSEFKNGVSRVSLTRKEWFLINTKGEKISRVFQRILPTLDNISYPAKLKGKYGYIDLQGNTLSPFVYKMAYPISKISKMGKFREGKLWGYIGSDFEIKIPAKFEQTGQFQNGIYSVKKDGLWGYINEDGKALIDYKFDKTGIFSKTGYALVTYQGKKELIDLHGNLKSNLLKSFEWDDWLETRFDDSRGANLEMRFLVVRKLVSKIWPDYQYGIYDLEKNKINIVPEINGVPSNIESFKGQLYYEFVRSEDIFESTVMSFWDFEYITRVVSLQGQRLLTLKGNIEDILFEKNRAVFGQRKMYREPFSSLAETARPNKLGLQDLVGNIILTKSHDEIMTFSDDRFMVVKNAKTYLIDLEGNIKANCPHYYINET